MFGYTIVKKIYIKRLKEELATEWDLDRNQPMTTTMLEEIETQEQTIAALTGENEELKIQIAELMTHL